jgi:hypothetical protein
VTSLKEPCVGVWWKECGSQGALLDAEDRNRESILEVALCHVTLGVFHKKNEISGLLSWASDHNVLRRTEQILKFTCSFLLWCSAQRFPSEKVDTTLSRFFIPLSVPA